MSTIVNESNVHARLRDKAEAQLEAGTAPATGQWSMGIDTLRLLHSLSSDPNSADDALKLLHELQVHQVEIDLQNEEIATNGEAVVEDLRLYRTLYDSAPFAYFVVDVDGVIVQGNLIAARLFGVGQDDLEGQRIDTFLNPQSRSLLLGLIKRVAQSGARDSCVVETRVGLQEFQNLQFSASIPPGRRHISLVCCECGMRRSAD
ncbi:PAS domain S-box protein [Parahaliea aestuarii]|uniref:PAS domain S-box protein n=1 Tax=Parahaliea aestuarii TaxID=1852021 RepID=A0A5C8ZW10_9GAMM|nr:PAS domain S-box protein [Parahaliea aestuarii]TXS91647.1 PAS domain S-box protein [Parahaliea aestuarii]